MPMKLLTYGWRRQVLEPHVMLAALALVLDEIARITSAAARVSGDLRWNEAGDRLFRAVEILRGRT